MEPVEDLGKWVGRIAFGILAKINELRMYHADNCLDHLALGEIQWNRRKFHIHKLRSDTSGRDGMDDIQMGDISAA